MVTNVISIENALVCKNADKFFPNLKIINMTAGNAAKFTSNDMYIRERLEINECFEVFIFRHNKLIH